MTVTTMRFVNRFNLDEKDYTNLCSILKDLRKEPRKQVFMEFNRKKTNSVSPREIHNMSYRNNKKHNTQCRCDVQFNPRRQLNKPYKIIRGDINE